jgi:galactokinase
LSDFRSLFGRSPTVTVDAPGRVNLIGEHTDYNGGFVLPTAIPQRTQVELAPRSDTLVRVHSAKITKQTEPVEYTLGAETPGRDWLDYVQGITLLLRKDRHCLSGFDVCISSTVPIGSGLSSSAALEVSLLRALRIAFQLPLDDVDLARLGQRAENEFVGAQCGIMDQMAAVFADDRHALFLDARTLRFQRVPLPADADLVVINSGVVHDLTLGDYNTRRVECEKACRILGVSQLRDLQGSGLDCLDPLPEPLKRRARHVLTENERVLQAVDAMRQGDLPRLGQLFFASHRSMREDYQVSVPEIDLLVELAHNHAEVYGARLTGGGFGGSVVLLARAGTGGAVAQRLARSYADRSGRRPTVLVPAGISEW